jgi:TnpA family transposase
MPLLDEFHSWTYFMTRKILLSAAQRERFFALPSDGADLIRHYTLSADDIALINRRRRPQNRLGFAVQLCLMRYPGRTLGPGESPATHSSVPYSATHSVKTSAISKAI